MGAAVTLIQRFGWHGIQAVLKLVHPYPNYRELEGIAQNRYSGWKMFWHRAQQ